PRLRGPSPTASPVVAVVPGAGSARARDSVPVPAGERAPAAADPGGRVDRETGAAPAEAPDRGPVLARDPGWVAPARGSGSVPGRDRRSPLDPIVKQPAESSLVRSATRSTG